MKLLVAVVLLGALAHARDVPTQATTAYGYLKNIGVPEAERIRKAEDEYLNNPSRIVGGTPAILEQNPWQAGLLINLVGFNGTAVCGGSLVGENIVITAAHCSNDGQNQAWRFTVVLGSTLLFSGGTRIETSVVVTHPNWFPLLIRNDVAVIYLPQAVTFSASISPISLPSGAELEDTFTGVTASASGFGVNADGSGISSNQFLSQVSLNVISNTLCSLRFPGIVQSSNLCTSGSGGVGPCGGDSGGPLTVTRNNKQTLIGVVSFGSARGCSVGFPGVFARVTSYINFFNQHINSARAILEINQ